MQNNLRFGYVSDYDAKKHAARVLFPDMDSMISGWLPVCVPASKDTRYYRPLGINEHVACLVNDDGTGSGVILGSIYDDSTSPGNPGEGVHGVNFGDGTEITYDAGGRKLSVKCAGDIIISAGGSIEITAGKNITVHAEKGALSGSDVSGGKF